MRLTFPPFQFPLDSFANKASSIFAFGQNGVNPAERSLREPGLHVLVPQFCASHHLFSYELLTMHTSYEKRTQAASADTEKRKAGKASAQPKVEC